MHEPTPSGMNHLKSIMSAPASRRLQRGSRVRAHGLQSRPQHNGSGGVVLAQQNDRWQVRLDDTTELALRPANLQLEDPPPLPPPHMSTHAPRLDQQCGPLPTKDGVPLQMKMLRQVEQETYPEISVDLINDLGQLNDSFRRINDSLPEAVALMHHRHAQRVSLEKLLIIPESVFATDPLLNLPICVVLERSIDATHVHPRQLLSYALTCQAWAAFVRAWLVSAQARPFWQRVCVATLPEGVVMHPELCTKELLLEWVRLRPAVGTRQHWYVLGMGLASDGLTEDSMSELELAVLLAQLFVLWWNVGIDEDSPCFVGWMRLYFEPWLDGPTHATEATPGEWENPDRTPMSLLANVCDCIQDFRNCPGVTLPGLVEEQLLRTLRALIARFHIQKPRNTGQWRFTPMSSAQNGSFYELLRRYAPLFPQGSDREPRVPMPPVFVSGRRRTRYPRPRPLMYPLLPSHYNTMLVLDRSNTDAVQEIWKLDEQQHEVMEGWEEYEGANAPGDDSSLTEDDEDEDEDDEDDEDEDEGEEDEGEENEEVIAEALRLTAIEANI